LGEKFVNPIPQNEICGWGMVGVGSFKPGKQKKPGNFIRHDFLFPFNEAMNILGGHESYNTPAKK
jgi:hypothetical protein